MISHRGMPPIMPQPPPQPQIAYQPLPIVVEQPASAWYLRGDVGVGMPDLLGVPLTPDESAFVWPASWPIVQQIQDTVIFGFGIGYEFNNWLRLDVTGEYRTKAAFKVTGSYTEFWPGRNLYSTSTNAYSKSTVFMANAYIDLGTWWCLTPYIGGGIGGAYNTSAASTDTGIATAQTASATYAIPA
jgi:opacity protein-like surface antigen